MIEKKMARIKEDTMVTLPNELVFFDILTRLPVKPLLWFRSVSKLWSSVLSSPPFINLHLNRSLDGHHHDFSLLIRVYDRRSSQQHFLSAEDRDGPATLLLTLPSLFASQNLNGLVCLHRLNGITYRSYHNVNSDENFVYLCNPGTRKIYTLPVNFHITTTPVHISYNFGYSLSCDKYKVLNIRIVCTGNTPTEVKKKTECEIFTLGTDSWRKIETVLPFDFRVRSEGLSVNGALYWIFEKRNIIVGFDLADEKFYTFPLPRISNHSNETHFIVGGFGLICQPYLIKNKGLLCVVYYEHVLEKNMMELWILEDSQNQVWNMDTIMFPSPWEELMCPHPDGTIYTGEILLNPHLSLFNPSVNASVFLHFYDMKRRTFRRIEITLPERQHPEHIEIRGILSYTQSLLTLGINE